MVVWNSFACRFVKVVLIKVHSRWECTGTGLVSSRPWKACASKHPTPWLLAAHLHRKYEKSKLQLFSTFYSIFCQQADFHVNDFFTESLVVALLCAFYTDWISQKSVKDWSLVFKIASVNPKLRKHWLMWSLYFLFPFGSDPLCLWYRIAFYCFSLFIVLLFVLVFCCCISPPKRSIMMGFVCVRLYRGLCVALLYLFKFVFYSNCLLA